jgi:sporulation protein YlmC with PRC-barrel domain
MLQSIKQLYGNKLGASDGEIGQVKDFYFDDQTWAIRYLVADTGTWLAGRQVLIAPHAFDRLHQPGKILCVNLTRKQIENCPSIASHKPVSRQYEEEYYRYFGWPSYWQGGALWGMIDFPNSELIAKSIPGESTTASDPQADRVDAHLRSTRAVNGYQLQIGGKNIGHVCDFMMDARSWKISELVIKTGHRLSGNEEQIPTSQVERISYDESTVFASLTKEAIEQSSAQTTSSVATAN